MPRQKTIKKFDKNHILITETLNMNNPEEHAVILTGSAAGSNQSRRYASDNYITKTVLSPLGFYYETKVLKSEEETPDERLASKAWVEVIVTKRDSQIKILYYTSFANKRLNAETRPWNLFPDGVFSDANIDDLKNDIDAVLSDIDDNRIDVYDTFYYMGRNQYREIPLSDLKSKIYTDLFGSPRGLTIQTDKEKIMSHGFDVVTSFRNM